MIDFTNCKELFNIYSGSEKKKTLIYENERYLVKFPDPIRQKNKNISYINNAYSEYIGSHIFELCGFNVQKTILGKYYYNGKEKIVCACKDFTDYNNILYEFESMALSFNPDKKIDTELRDIINVLEESEILANKEDIKDKFYDMFIVDFLIGNTERHNGNWGFIVNDDFKISFSTIYDCGSCLNPLLEDNDLENMDDVVIKNFALNVYSALKENGKKIHYVSYVKNMNNKDITNALERIYPKIDMNKINDFIDNIDCISNVRKSFYKKIMEIRFNILKDVYNKIELEKWFFRKFPEE